MDPINIKYVNAHYIVVQGGDRSIRQSISDHFSYLIPNHQYMPKFKSGQWDGRIRLFNMRSGMLPSGLTKDLVKFLDGSNWEYTIDDIQTRRLVNASYDRTNELNDFINGLPLRGNKGQEITIRDYQRTAALKKYQDERGVIISAPGSGKSLIIYLLIRLYLNDYHKDLDSFKVPEILVIVPTIALVEQMFKDICAYCKDDPSFPDPENLIARVHNKSAKDNSILIGKGITISTWQSIYKLQAVEFENYKLVIGDECHKFKAKSLVNLMTKCTRSRYRIGTTGTIDFKNENHMTIKSCFGGFEKLKGASFNELINKSELSQLNIKILQLNHSDEPDIETYQDEIKYIFACEKRNRLIQNLSLDLPGNTLILFKRVDSHGKILYQQICDANEDPDRIIKYVSGETHTDIREEVRELAEENKKVILVCSVGVFSTGINIKELHNLILAAPTKAQIEILQSLGRVLRRSSTNTATVYDFADNIMLAGGKKKKQNYGMRHLEERIRIYKDEQFNFTIYPIEI